MLASGLPPEPGAGSSAGSGVGSGSGSGSGPFLITMRPWPSGSAYSPPIVPFKSYWMYSMSALLSKSSSTASSFMNMVRPSPPSTSKNVCDTSL